MNVPDAAWLAGLLEGEGYFIERRGANRSPARVDAKMTDRDVIERVAELFGGKAVTEITHKNKRWKTSYVTRVSGLEAISVMKQILQRMGERRREAIEMLIYL